MNLKLILINCKKNGKNIWKNHKKMTIVSFFSIVLVVWIIATSSNSIVENKEKINFYIQTKTLEEFSKDIEINKPGKIMWAQEILLTSQAAWSVEKIYFNEWEKVWEDENLIKLDDNIANYNLMVERAKNALNSARLQYQQNQTQIDQLIQWNKLALESSQQTYQTTQSIWQQNVKSAENTLKTSNNQKNSILLQMESEKNKLDSFLSNVLHQIDTILWVTTKYKTMNDSFEIYLSAKNSSYKLQGQKELKDLYKQVDIINWISTNSEIANSEIKNNIEKMNTTYNDIKKILETMNKILTNSVSSTSLTQTQIDWMISLINWLDTAFQTNFAMFISLKQTVDNSLLAWDWDYELIWQESSEIWYQSTIISTEKQIFDAWLWVKSAELNYDTAIKNKSNTLWLAAANIKSAEIAYQDALNQLEKLKIKSPITWTIWKVLIDKWQEIWIWTPMITIINNNEPTVEIWINTKEYEKINSWSKVLVNYMWENITWKLISISSQAWWNGLYNATIKLDKKVEIIWDTAEIKIYNKNDKFTLPINIVKPLEKNQAYIYILKENKPEILNIQIWEVWWDRIEVISEIPQWTQIIVNEIWNYNTNTHNIIIENSQTK